MTPTELLTEAERLGLTLHAEGERLFITPGSKAPAEFVQSVREHKPALLALLSTGEGEQGRPFDATPQAVAESAARWLTLGSLRPLVAIWPDL